MVRIGYIKNRGSRRNILEEESEGIGVRFILGRAEDMNGEVMENETGEGGGTDIVWFLGFDFCHVGNIEFF